MLGWFARGMGWGLRVWLSAVLAAVSDAFALRAELGGDGLEPRRYRVAGAQGLLTAGLECQAYGHTLEMNLQLALPVLLPFVVWRRVVAELLHCYGDPTTVLWYSLLAARYYELVGKALSIGES